MAGRSDVAVPLRRARLGGGGCGAMSAGPGDASAEGREEAAACAQRGRAGGGRACGGLRVTGKEGRAGWGPCDEDFAVGWGRAPLGWDAGAGCSRCGWQLGRSWQGCWSPAEEAWGPRCGLALGRSGIQSIREGEPPARAPCAVACESWALSEIPGKDRGVQGRHGDGVSDGPTEAPFPGPSLPVVPRGRAEVPGLIRSHCLGRLVSSGPIVWGAGVGAER